MSFTAEEAWLARYPNAKSIHLELFPSLPFEWDSPKLAKKYEKLRDIRKVMTGALEVARASKEIGSSLQGNLTVFLDPAYRESINGVDLAELAIVSSLKVEDGKIPEDVFKLDEVEGVGALVSLASGEKCARCWKILEEVGEIKTHPDLCGRCARVVEAMSEG